MQQVEIFTDGSCRGNPGPGGWGVILRCKSIEKELSGAEEKTTNNRMELTAVIEALKNLKKPCKVNLYSDSNYVCNSINKNWVKKWQENNWIKSDKKPALNIDLWSELLNLLKIHEVKFNWIKGHNSHLENERCDKLAVNAALNIINKK